MRVFGGALYALAVLCAASGAWAQSAEPGTGRLYVVPMAPGGGSATATVTQGGSTGTDYSANAATIPMAGFVLLATIPIIPNRAAAEVQNQSAATIQVVRDDGAGGNQTTILVAPGAGSAQQGGGWSSATFKGRVRVYGPAGSQVSADQE